MSISMVFINKYLLSSQDLNVRVHVGSVCLCFYNCLCDLCVASCSSVHHFCSVCHCLLLFQYSWLCGTVLFRCHYFSQTWFQYFNINKSKCNISTVLIKVSVIISTLSVYVCLAYVVEALVLYYIVLWFKNCVSYWEMCVSRLSWTRPLV